MVMFPIPKKKIIKENISKREIKHLYDDLNLTLNDFNTIFSNTIKGNLIGTEKIDGYNCKFTFRNDSLRIARNKTEIESGGLTESQLMSREFAGGEEVKKIFIEAFYAVEDFFYTIPKDKTDILFENDNILWLNCEIVSKNQNNLLSYDKNSVIFHQTGWGFSKKGSSEFENVENSSDIYAIFLDFFENSKDKEFGKGFQILSMPIMKIESIEKWKVEKVSELFEQIWSKNGLSKNDPLKKLDENSQRQIKLLINQFSDAVLSRIKGILTKNNTVEESKTREKLKKAYKAAKKYNGEDSDKVKQLVSSFDEQIPNIETLRMTTEGFVFNYSGTLYKITGQYSISNQIYSLYKSGRGKIPPLSGLQELGSVDKGFYNRVSNKGAHSVDAGSENLDGRRIYIFPGSFKPPHKGHFNIVKNLLESNFKNKIDKFIVLISQKERTSKSGDIVVDHNQSKQIWDIFASYLDIEVRVSDHSTPIKDVYDIIKKESEQNDRFHVIKSNKEGQEDKRFSGLQSFVEKENLNVKIEFIDADETPSVSSSFVREAISSSDMDKVVDFMPDELSEEDKRSIIAIFDARSKKKEKYNIFHESKQFPKKFIKEIHSRESSYTIKPIKIPRFINSSFKDAQEITDFMGIELNVEDFSKLVNALIEYIEDNDIQEIENIISKDFSEFRERFGDKKQIISKLSYIKNNFETKEYDLLYSNDPATIKQFFLDADEIYLLSDDINDQEILRSNFVAKVIIKDGEVKDCSGYLCDFILKEFNLEYQPSNSEQWLSKYDSDNKKFKIVKYSDKEFPVVELTFSINENIDSNDLYQFVTNKIKRCNLKILESLSDIIEFSNGIDLFLTLRVDILSSDNFKNFEELRKRVGKLERYFEKNIESQTLKEYEFKKDYEIEQTDKSIVLKDVDIKIINFIEGFVFLERLKDYNNTPISKTMQDCRITIERIKYKKIELPLKEFIKKYIKNDAIYSSALVDLRIESNSLSIDKCVDVLKENSSLIKLSTQSFVNKEIKKMFMLSLKHNNHELGSSTIEELENIYSNQDDESVFLDSKINEESNAQKVSDSDNIAKKILKHNLRNLDKKLGTTSLENNGDIEIYTTRDDKKSLENIVDYIRNVEKFEWNKNFFSKTDIYNQELGNNELFNKIEKNVSYYKNIFENLLLLKTGDMYIRKHNNKFVVMVNSKPIIILNSQGERIKGLLVPDTINFTDINKITI